MPDLDFSFAQALPVQPYQASHLHLYLVGLGGTGSFLARHMACLVSLLRTAGKQATLTFVDPDHVEPVNIPRQHFCTAELGRNKAETLATRLGLALGLEIGFIPQPFDPDMVPVQWESLTVLVGCVDRASGRLAMGKTLEQNRQFLQRHSRTLPRVWYLDLGNSLDGGQALLGCVDSVEDMAEAFALSGLPRCSLLPSPLLQEPGLREARPEEQEGHNLSCAELLAANAQSLTINPVMADMGADYLYRLLVVGNLKRFATTIDLQAGVMRSRYTTPQALAQVLGCQPSFFRPALTPTTPGSH